MIRLRPVVAVIHGNNRNNATFGFQPFVTDIFFASDERHTASQLMFILVPILARGSMLKQRNAE